MIDKKLAAGAAVMLCNQFQVNDEEIILTGLLAKKRRGKKTKKKKKNLRMMNSK